MNAHDQRRFVPLHWKLTAGVAALLTAISLLTVLILSKRLNDSALASEKSRAKEITYVLAKSIEAGVEFGDEKQVNENLNILGSVPGATYGVVVFPEQEQVFAKFLADASQTAMSTAALQLLQKKDWDAEPQVITLDNALHVGVRWETVDLKTLVPTPVMIAVGFSLAKLESTKRTNVAIAFVISAIAIAVGAALAWLLGSLLVRPVTELTRVTTEIVSKGDLTPIVEIHTRDEVSDLARSFSRMMEALREVLIRAKTTVERVSSMSRELTHTGEAVASGSRDICERLNRSEKTIEHADHTIHALTAKVKELNSDAVDATDAVTKIAALNRRVASNVESMSASVEDTASEIEESFRAAVEIARMLSKVDDDVSVTSSSMAEIHATIKEIERNALRTSEFSDTAAKKAASGVEAMLKTAEGVDAIRASVTIASEVIQSLVEQIESIDRIVSVIDEVAEQTSLLALNAAIIAAQAGEHGRGFSVVADEIKTLSDRTSRSTGEIAAVIRGVQAESERAVSAMEKGMSRVGEGMKLAKDTREALKEIAESSEVAMEMVNGIAAATTQQASGVTQVNEAMARIAMNIQDISRSSSQQADGVKHVAKSTESMRLLAKGVLAATQEQNRGSERVIGSIERIAEISKVVDSVQKDQAAASQGLIDAVNTIRSLAEGQMVSVSSLEKALTVLRDDANDLQGVLEQFKADR